MMFAGKTYTARMLEYAQDLVDYEMAIEDRARSAVGQTLLQRS